MPEIAALAAVPTPPSGGAVSVATPPAPREGATPTGEGTASFLTQLQSALGSLGLFSQLTPTPTPVADTADQRALALELPIADEDQDKAVDVTAMLPEVLAALGFMPVPISLPVTPAPASGSSATAPTSAAATGPARVTALLVQPALSQAEPVLENQPAVAEQPLEGASVSDDLLRQMTPVTPRTVSVPATTTAQPSVEPVALESSSQLTAAATSALPPGVPTTTTAPTPVTTTTQPLDALAAQAGVMTPRTEPATRGQDGAPTAEAPVQTIGQALPVARPAAFSQNAGQNGESTSDEPSSDAAPVSAERGSTSTATDVPIQAFANVAASALVQQTGTLSEVQPAHVASQIAHQAELYRLPGGRGVRIELNPEDLGGVGVTIKYGATGGVELHIVAEQAATAQLVQSGWNDLRSALSLQGIAPERLIMSVSTPSESNSTGSGSQATFGQAGQSSQHHSDRNEAKANRGWAGIGDAPINVSEDPRPSGAASSSRIDYRV
jgi:flagellar hook-length control protein FliK